MENLKYNLVRQNGITLVGLIITVVVMLIIAGVSIYSGTESLNSTRLRGFYTQLEIAQKRVDDITATNESFINDSGETVELKLAGVAFEDLEQDKKDNLTRIISLVDGDVLNYSINNFRYFTTKEIKELLNIHNIDDNLFIDFENRIIIAEKGIEINDIEYHMLESTMFFIKKRAQEFEEDDVEFTVDILEYGKSKYKLKVIPKTEHNGKIKYKDISTKYWEDSSNFEVLIDKIPAYYDILYYNIDKEKSLQKTFGISKNEEGKIEITLVKKIYTPVQLLNINEEFEGTIVSYNRNVIQTQILNVEEKYTIPVKKQYLSGVTDVLEEKEYKKEYLLMNNLSFRVSDYGIDYWKPVGELDLNDVKFTGNNKNINLTYTDSDGEDYIIEYNELNQYKEKVYEFVVVPIILEEEKKLEDAIITINKNGEQTQEIGTPTLSVRRGLDNILVKASVDNISYKESETVNIEVKNPNKIRYIKDENNEDLYYVPVEIEYNYITFRINTEPKNATVIINNQTIEEKSNGIFEVSNIIAGRDDVSWKVSANGYVEQIGNKLKSEIIDDVSIDVNLKRWVKLTIVQPKGSSLVINRIDGKCEEDDGVDGNSNKYLIVEEGSKVIYNLSKTNYDTITDGEIQVGNKDETVTLELKPTMVNFSIKPIQNNASVEIKNSSGTILASGTGIQSVYVQKGTTLSWKVSCLHYWDKVGEAVAENTELSVELDPKLVTFKITPTPSEATVTINGTETKEVTVQEGSTVNWEVSRSHYLKKTGGQVVNSDTTLNVTLDPIMVTLTVKATGHSDATVKIWNSNNTLISQSTGSTTATVIEGSKLKYAIEKKYYQKIMVDEIYVDATKTKEHSLTMNEMTYVSLGPSNATGDNSDIKNLSYACSRPNDDDLRANSGTATNRTVTYTFSGFNLPTDALVQGIYFSSRHGTSSNAINTDVHYTLKLGSTTVFDEEVNSECIGSDNLKWKYVTTSRKYLA